MQVRGDHRLAGGGAPVGLVPGGGALPSWRPLPRPLAFSGAGSSGAVAAASRRRLSAGAQECQRDDHAAHHQGAHPCTHRVDE